MSRRRKNEALESHDKYEITPMIDVVFLLLIFFMVTTDLTEEADMSITLPAQVTPPDDVQLPDTYVVDILPSGDILLNGAPMDHPDSRAMPQLVRTLERLRASAERSGSRIAVSVVADPASLHQRSIDVLNACAAASVRYVSFAAE